MPTHFDGTPSEVLALNTYIELTRTANVVTTRLLNSGTLGGLTLSQFGVLETLYHLGPMRQGEICTKLLMSGGNITHVVDNLEDHGLAQRARSSADRRVIVVSLTPAGEALIRRLLPGHVAAILYEMNVLTDIEQETLGHLCRVLGKRERCASAGGAPEDDRQEGAKRT
jgi:MarR family 2-MHQ and catechol resistance regulon transcriptional repressor